MSDTTTAGELSCSRLSTHITYGNISLREITKAIEVQRNALESCQHFNGKITYLLLEKRFSAWHRHFIQKVDDDLP